MKADPNWLYPDFDRFDWQKHEAELQRQKDGNPDSYDEDAAGEYDEREPEIEGSRLYDVGWMRVKLYTLIPHLYQILIGPHSWDTVHSRPPEVFGR